MSRNAIPSSEQLVERAAERAAEKLTDTIRAIVTEIVSAGGRPYLSTAELAEELGVAVVTLEQWRARGEGPPHVRLGRRVVYRRADIDAWIDRNSRGAA